MIYGRAITLGGGGGGTAKTLATLAEGALVAVREGGVLTPFYLAKKGYEPDLNSGNRYLLVRKDCCDDRAWNATNVNTYASSDIDTWLNSEYKGKLSSQVQANMGLTKFEYTPGNGDATVSTLQRAAFLLSLTELGGTHGGANVEGEALPIADALKIAYRDGAATAQWTRSPYKDDTHKYVMVKTEAGADDVRFTTASEAPRPCFTLPSNMEIADEPNADGSYSLLCDATIDSLDDLAEGATVSITENGMPKPYYVAKHNYESGLNGAGRTLLVRKYSPEARVFDSTTSNAIETSDTFEWLNGSFLGKLSEGIRKLVSTTRYYMTPGGGNNTVTTGQTAVFIPSVTEFGLSSNYANVEGTALPIASKLKIAYHEAGNANHQWTRSPYNNNATYMNMVLSDGTFSYAVGNSGSYAILPCFTLPGNATLGDLNSDGSYSLAADNGEFTLAGLPEGALVNIEENGTDTAFYIVKQDYEASLNGSGRTLLCRKECADSVSWNSTAVNTYADSGIDGYFNTTYKEKLPTAIQDNLGSTKFEYTPGNGNKTKTTLQRAVFALSATELEFSTAWSNVEGTASPAAAILQIAYKGSTASAQHTRTPSITDNVTSVVILATGKANNQYCNSPYPTRPAFTLPASLKLDPTPNSDGSYNIIV